VPQTLGVTERLDVQAAVGYLRKLSYVDQSRISVLGTGTGATAAMLARRDDASIEHVIAYDPVESFDRVLRENINSPWLKPAVRWGFEIAHRVDVEDLDRDQLLRQLKEDVLLLDSHPARPPQRQMIARYLQAGAQQISEAR
jgi:dienelactone hydrolase